MKTKIICTIGPASHNFDIMKEMKLAGMNIARVNTKYGNLKQWIKIIENAKRLDIELLIDIKGDKFIEWASSQNFEYLAISFVENARMINSIRKKFNKKIKIISKIETKNGIKNIDGIIKSSWGVMVARGDLAENVSFEKVPVLQREIIKKCRASHKFVITATEMLLSMTKSTKPTRAETSDVATAVFLGSHALMLSEETAIGKHPVLATLTMRKITNESEKSLNKK